MIKFHYSTAELVAFDLPCLPKSYRAIDLKIGREKWSFVEVKAKGGRGGVRREYQPTAEVMAEIKKVMLDQILENSIKQENIIGISHEKTALLTQPTGQNARTLDQNRQHGSQCNDKNQHAGILSVGADQQQNGLRSVTLLPGNDQPAQPALNEMARPSQGRVYGVTGHGLAQVGALKDWQRRTAEARAALLREVERIAAIVGREKAITKVVIMAQDGTLPEHLALLVPVANARSGREGKRTLSRSTMYDWFAAFKSESVNALAPKDQHASMRVPVWAQDLLVEYMRPQKPSLSWAVEQIAVKHGLDKESLYHRARRFLAKMGNVEQQVGRMGSRDIKNIKPFVRRDSSMLWPGEVYTADGHTFDAEVAHPAHGKAFRPEITAVIDVATRKKVGWSVDLAESGLAVLDALRHACEVGGIPALFYVDNGSGYKNALMSQPGVGMESRLGFTMTHSIPYNSQARGIIERSHQSVWVRAAKELPTYIGASMDAQAKQKVHKLTRRDIKLIGTSKLLMPFNAFIAYCSEQVSKYNARPHRGLPKLFDATLGRKRNMTPDEAWQKGIDDGAQLVRIGEEDARDLFRPQREVKAVRGELRLFGNQYFAQELTEYHGDIVRVAYDIHNANTVWVYDNAGRYVCSAGFEANKRAYFPETFVEQAARKRAKGREARLENKLAEVHEELHGAPLVLENNPSPTLASLRVVNGMDAAYTQVAANLDSAASLTLAVEESAPTASGNAQLVDVRPVFMIDSDRYEWLMQHRDGWTDADQRFLTEFVASDIYDALSERFEALDIAWNGGHTNIFKVAV